jgi:hypothetical protein
MSLNHWEKEGLSHIDISIMFPSTGYNVSDWGTLSIVGYNISVNAKIWFWTGTTLPVVITKSYTYDLGYLSTGEYIFIFNVWESPIKSIKFTVAKPVGGYSFATEGYTPVQPLTFYLALTVILTASFTAIKRKTQRRTKHS